MTTRIITGDCRSVLADMPDESVHCVVTSPPYWGLRDYGIEPTIWDADPACEHEWGDVYVRPPGGKGTQSSGLNGAQTSAKYRERLQEQHQMKGVTTHFCGACGAWRGSLGFEPSPDLYVEHMVQVFREVRRVLRADGTLWLNVGDSYAGGGRGGNPAESAHRKQAINTGSVTGLTKNKWPVPDGIKPKDLVGIPWMLAFALRADGWYLRSEITWAKKAPMPESVTDRPTTATEKVFLLSKGARYFYDAEAVKEEAEKGAAGSFFDRGKTAAHQLGRASHAAREENGTRNMRNWWLLGPEPFNEWGETVRLVRVEADAPVDGKKRKASPDCPLHGDRRPALASNGRDDGHAGDVLSRTDRSNARRARGPQADFVPIALRHAQPTEQQSSDLPLLQCSSSATPHSSESRRTALAPETNRPCTASAQTGGRTECTSEQPSPSGLAERTRASKTSSDLAPVGASRSADNSSEPLECTCEWYIEKTEKTSHFATFPTEIPRRAILAGTSEKGVCPKCGAPWERVIAKEKRARGGAFGVKDVGEFDHGQAGTPYMETIATVTIGWQPTCGCNAGNPIPAGVLDCFAGSGTTLLVADQLRRDCIGIELNPEYADMIRRRIERDAGMFAEVTAD